MSAFIASSTLHGWRETGGVISPGLFRSATPGRSCLPSHSVGSRRGGSARPGTCASPHKTDANPPDLAVVEGTVFPSALVAGGFSPVGAGRAPASTDPRRYRIRRAEHRAPDTVGVPESSMCLHPERMSRFPGLCKANHHCLARREAEIPP